MKVIQVPFCFYPDPVGGTEVYVDALSRNLQQQGVEVLVAAPGEVNQSYQYNQLPVRRFAVSPKVENLREIYGEGDRQAALEFSRILEAEQPDLVHLHAFTSGVSLRLVQAAKKRQIPVVFTYHTPTVSCQRGTMMRWGTEICDGKVDLQTCAQCTLQGLGLNLTSAKAIGSLPPQIGRWLGNLNLQGGAWTALRMTELVSLRHTVLQALLSEVDHIVAVCNWVRDVLLVNHVPSDKITVIRQGLCQDLPKKADHSHNCTTPILKIAFLGRLDPTKGIDILIQALQAVPELPISLDIYGIARGANDPYQQELHNLALKDPRISFKAPVATTQVTATLANYDLLAVPSQWLETGPLVVLEAFATQVPVIGSDLGGIAELVESEVNGILVEPASVVAWSQALQRLCQNRDLLMQLKAGIRQPQTMATVAQEMEKIYLSLKTTK
ncbi:glycosyltransferase family 4 protein [Nostoc sp. CENA67]|uniref:Glycosyltransferase family 4 protein n=1 Tax=Amazonocrinis nigriterrae CENA67 TaxID=2794033 RepID=A0A8J7HPP0_9NOST|nr:glycosyltransferase family 4 protein [Amazonocrinis nigriterrae]MBH8561047.1 glycosyltransferase family 4 protein [Amazonocrinis nigriterrae CENA67]